MGLELEIKLKVAGSSESPGRPDEIKTRLEKMGAVLVHPREFEDNLAFDFPDRAIVRQGCLLRVRILERGVLLTWKGPVQPMSGAAGLVGPSPDAMPGSDSGTAGSDAGATSAFKARQETEVMYPSSDAGALLAILKGLGMEPVFRYQKYRTTWEWKGLHVTLDETPIGVYLELEGDRGAIDDGARALGFTPQEYITASYRDLYLEHASRVQGAPGDFPRDRMMFPAKSDAC